MSQVSQYILSLFLRKRGESSGGEACSYSREKIFSSSVCCDSPDVSGIHAGKREHERAGRRGSPTRAISRADSMGKANRKCEHKRAPRRVVDTARDLLLGCVHPEISFYKGMPLSTATSLRKRRASSEEWLSRSSRWRAFFCCNGPWGDLVSVLENRHAAVLESVGSADLGPLEFLLPCGCGLRHDILHLGDLPESRWGPDVRRILFLACAFAHVMHAAGAMRGPRLWC